MNSSHPAPPPRPEPGYVLWARQALSLITPAGAPSTSSNQLVVDGVSLAVTATYVRPYLDENKTCHATPDCPQALSVEEAKTRYPWTQAGPALTLGAQACPHCWPGYAPATVSRALAQAPELIELVTAVRAADRAHQISAADRSRLERIYERLDRSNFHDLLHPSVEPTQAVARDIITRPDPGGPAPDLRLDVVLPAAAAMMRWDPDAPGCFADRPPVPADRKVRGMLPAESVTALWTRWRRKVANAALSVSVGSEAVPERAEAIAKILAAGAHVSGEFQDLAAAWPQVLAPVDELLAQWSARLGELLAAPPAHLVAVRPGLDLRAGAEIVGSRLACDGRVGEIIASLTAGEPHEWSLLAVPDWLADFLRASGQAAWVGPWKPGYPVRLVADALTLWADDSAALIGRLREAWAFAVHTADLAEQTGQQPAQELPAPRHEASLARGTHG